MNTRKSFRLFFLFFALILLLQVVACGSGNNGTGNFQVVVFSDVHFNPFYDPDPSLFQKLVTEDAGRWADVFKTSTITAHPEWGKDTNYPLLALALSSIKQNRGSSPLIIFTGDILGHAFAQQFYARYYGGQGVPAPPAPDATAVKAMQAFADKTVAFFTEQVKASAGTIPVMFAVGNNDSYADLGPDSTFLASTAEYFYSNFLKGTVDHQAFLTSFKNGGYYSAEPPGTDLMVIGLNTVMFSSLVPGDASAVTAELAWLDSTLASAEAAGKKVWLLMHEPPGAGIRATAATVDVNGHIAAATMLWKPEYQAGFLQILLKYSEIIALRLAGHTHMDEFRVLSSSDVIEITPSISPSFGNNPAFRVLTLSRDTYKPTDYRSLNYDLATNPGQFNDYYSFSEAYSAQTLLDDSLEQLVPVLLSNRSKQLIYRKFYYSGNNAPNFITDTNWPVFYCGIANLDKQAFTDCVNSR